MNYIFYTGKLLERAGGPSTYLFNLKLGIYNKKINNVKFIYNENTNENIINKKSLTKKIITKCPRVYEYLMLKRMNYIPKDKIKNLQNIELIHFHSTKDLANSIRKGIIPKNAVKLLTSHSPEIPSLEIKKYLKTQCKNKKYNFEKIEKKYYEKYDKVAFEKADILVFPSEESMEPYFETCPEFKKLIQGKKIKYLLTGTNPLQYKKSREEFRKENNIPYDAFIICFVGRHNEIKGYDNFIKMTTDAMSKEKNIYVVTAGVGDIESPKNQRWIDIGWTNDPGSIINASDLFVLPNKRTYFDLVLLETLSIGKTCLVSNTGGNKTVAKLSNGIIKYDSVQQATNIILNLYRNQEKLKELEDENKKLYEQYFTIDKFTDNYIKMLEEIKNENKKII